MAATCKVRLEHFSKSEAARRGEKCDKAAALLGGPNPSSMTRGTKYGLAMDHSNYPDSYIRGILNTVKSIAMVGVSANESRPSYFAFKYLKERGYRMIPINPGLAGKELLGRKVYARLSDVEEPIDMVDVFRASQYAKGIVEEALKLNPLPRVIWMQLGVRDDDAAALAEAAGVRVVMNRCPKIEYGRLSSELSWMGVNSRTITSKRAKIDTTGVQRMSLGRVTMAGGTTDASTRAYEAGKSET
jgi:predicted CoA-binding protein